MSEERWSLSDQSICQIMKPINRIPFARKATAKANETEAAKVKEARNLNRCLTLCSDEKARQRCPIKAKNAKNGSGVGVTSVAGAKENTLRKDAVFAKRRSLVRMDVRLRKEKENPC